jgi:hypothetical protein
VDSGQLNIVNDLLPLHNNTDQLKNITFVNLKAKQSCILCDYVLNLTHDSMAEFTERAFPATNNWPCGIVLTNQT